MKIIVLIGLYPPHQLGGYEIRCKNIVDYLIEQGNEVEILTSVCDEKKCESHKTEKNIYRKLHDVHATKSRLEKYFFIISDLHFIKRRIQQFKPDLIYLWHITRFTKNLIPFLAEIPVQIIWDEGGRGISYVWNDHGSWHNFFNQKKDSKLFRIIKTYIKKGISIISGNVLKVNWQWPKNLLGYFNSEAGRNFASQCGVPINKYKVFYSGIDEKLFPFNINDIPTKNLNILLPGRIEEIKNQKDGVKLLNFLIHNDISTHLTIVGHEYSEIYYREIIQYIKENTLEPYVSFIPMVSHQSMSEYYNKSDICFFPSKQVIGFSRIPLEAMASGCPVISYGFEGSNEVINNRETGFIVEESDFESIRLIVQKVISIPTKKRNIQIAARRMIDQNHTLELYAIQIETFLSEAVNKII